MVGTELQPFDHGLAVFDREHVSTELIGDQGGLRDDDALLRFAALDGDLNELAIDEFAIRIGDPGAHRHCVRRPVDLDVDEIDLSFLAIYYAVRELNAHCEVQCRLLLDVATFLFQPQKLTLADRKDDVHRIGADDRGQNT